MVFSVNIAGIIMVTVVILAKNEAANLESLLPTLSFADRVLVVDDYSDDSTEDVCRRNRAEWVQHALRDDFAAARNWALDYVKSGWVLFLDADERLTEPLISEIVAATNSGKFDGYHISRLDYFYGKTLKWGENKQANFIRLGLVGSGKWKGKVHEVWQIDKTGQLVNPILHYSHSDVLQLIKVVEKYSLIRAKELFEKLEYFNLWELLFFPPLKFLQLYFLKRGILDGWQGLVMCAAMAYHSFLVRWNLLTLGWIKLGLARRISRVLLVLIVLVLPLGQLERGFPFPIYVHEILMIFFLLVSLNWLRLSEQVGRFFKEQKWLVVFTGILGISFVTSLIKGSSVGGGLYWIRWGIYASFGMVLWDMVKKELLISTKGLLAYLMTMLLVFGWIQYIFMPDVRFLALLGWDDHYYRMVGTLFDPNFLGLMVVLFFIWRVKTRNKVWRLLLIGFCLLSLAATYSRASWLALIMLAGAYSLSKKRLLPLLLVVAAITGFVVVLPKPGGEGVNVLRQYSILTRMESLARGWEVIKDNPVLGIGFNQYASMVKTEGRYGATYLPKSPDNSLIFVGVTAGILGIVSFGLMITGWWKMFSDPVRRLSLVAILIHGMANNSFFYPTVLMWWLLLVAEYKQTVSVKN